MRVFTQYLVPSGSSNVCRKTKCGSKVSRREHDEKVSVNGPGPCPYQENCNALGGTCSYHASSYYYIIHNWVRLESTHEKIASIHRFCVKCKKWQVLIGEKSYHVLSTAICLLRNCVPSEMNVSTLLLDKSQYRKALSVHLQKIQPCS